MAFLPACETCAVFCAPSETDRAFWLETSEVCLTSSTVVVVSLTAVAVSVAAALQVLVQNLYVGVMERRYLTNERRALRIAEPAMPRLTTSPDGV